MAEAGTVHSDAPPSNAVIHVVEPIPFHIAADACFWAPRPSEARSRGICFIGPRLSQSRLSVFNYRGIGMRTARELMRQGRERSTSPFYDFPLTRGVTWLEPTLAVELTYSEVMEGWLRDPVYRGLV